MKILILSKYDEHGASSRYRSYNYRSYFDKNGISYEFKPLLAEGYVKNLYQNKRFLVFFQQIKSIAQRICFLLFSVKKYDLIVIEKELIPNMPYFVESFLLRKKAYTLDFDDYIATEYKLNAIKRLFLKNKIDSLAKKAKFVTVGNHWYFKEIKSNNLCYLPTVIDITNYPNTESKFNENKKTIVWIGSPSTKKYLENLIPVLQKIAKKYSYVLKIIGSEIKIEGVKVENVKWDANTEFDELLNSDIGIMPLENTLWEKGKCGFKLIQYMACGLPVIASPAPANEEIVKNEEQGFIAHNNEEWYVYLEKLLIDDTLCALMGQKGRKRIEENYTYQIWGDQYCDFIKQSLKK